MGGAGLTQVMIVMVGTVCSTFVGLLAYFAVFAVFDSTHESCTVN